MLFRHTNQASYPPSRDDAAPAGARLVVLSGTGTAETTTPKAMTGNHLHTLIVAGDVPVAVRFSGVSLAGGGVVDPADDLILPVGTIYHFVANQYAKFIAVESATGTGNYIVNVFQSGR